ncbi:MAG TPA: carbamate kinase, partial [Enterococcus sp.]|nr:carbamate kinase [Enterococcus sp.]
SVISLVTQVRVDPADPSFEKPSKPVGPFYSEEEANAAMAANGGVYQEDAGRGYRKVVPSPKPQEIVEKEAIKTLVDAGVITICAGGGGVPVVRNDNGFTG